MIKFIGFDREIPKQSDGKFLLLRSQYRLKNPSKNPEPFWYEEILDGMFYCGNEDVILDLNSVRHKISEFYYYKWFPVKDFLG